MEGDVSVELKIPALWSPANLQRVFRQICALPHDWTESEDRDPDAAAPRQVKSIDQADAPDVLWSEKKVLADVVNFDFSVPLMKFGINHKLGSSMPMN